MITFDYRIGDGCIRNAVAVTSRWTERLGRKDKPGKFAEVWYAATIDIYPGKEHYEVGQAPMQTVKITWGVNTNRGLRRDIEELNVMGNTLADVVFGHQHALVAKGSGSIFEGGTVSYEG